MILFKKFITTLVWKPLNKKKERIIYIVINLEDTLGLTAKSSYELAVHALGGVIWCLKKCLIDNEILSMRNFEIYEPVDNVLTQNIKTSEFKSSFAKQKYMVGITP